MIQFLFKHVWPFAVNFKYGKSLSIKQLSRDIALFKNKRRVPVNGHCVS